MKNLREFKIPYVGLKDGIHDFEFDIDDKFFEHFAESPISGSQLKVTLGFDKKPSLFILSFSIDGSMMVECDRCLEQFRQSIFGDYTVYVKLTEEEDLEEDEDDVVYHSRSETHFNVAPLIYDYINLSIPVQNIHPDDENGNPGCDPKVLAILEKMKEDKKQDTDPRWEALKKLQ